MATIKSSFSFKGAGKESFKAFTLTGTLYDAFKEVDKRVFGAILAGVYKMRETAGDLATIGAEEIRKSIAKKGSYKPYVDRRGKLRLSSNPGTPPAAVPEGDLLPSIYQTTTSKINQNPAVAEFGSKAPFAVELEYGTTKVAARPFLLPARQKVASVAENIILRDLRQAYKKSLSKSSSRRKIVVKMGR